MRSRVRGYGVNPRDGEWHLWWAWRPIKTTIRGGWVWVWWEYVERRYVLIESGNFWTYRLPAQGWEYRLREVSTADRLAEARADTAAAEGLGSQRMEGR